MILYQNLKIYKFLIKHHNLRFTRSLEVINEGARTLKPSIEINWP